VIEPITIQDNEEYLRQVSKEVNIHDKNLKYEIELLGKFCKEHDVMAMAAVQIGIPKRIIYLKNTDIDIINRMQRDEQSTEDKLYNEGRVLINPIIIERYGLTEYWEACASCLNLCGKVKRPYLMKVNYIDENYDVQEEWFEGFEATVLSHELDHLDGVLHMDVADEVIYMLLSERKQLRQKEGYKIIQKEDPYEELLNKYKEQVRVKK